MCVKFFEIGVLSLLYCLFNFEKCSSVFSVSDVYCSIVWACLVHCLMSAERD